jgi:hypothetical protein
MAGMGWGTCALIPPGSVLLIPRLSSRVVNAENFHRVTDNAIKDSVWILPDRRDANLGTLSRAAATFGPMADHRNGEPDALFHALEIDG